jgi:secretion/DNA translocation related TadE-like protein
MRNPLNNKPVLASTSRSQAHTSDRGSATIWVLGFAALIMAGSMVGVLRTTAVLARHQVERAADLAALAGAMRIGMSAEPCKAARRVAAANGAGLATCIATSDPSGRSGAIAITVQRTVRLATVGARDVTARARAVRLPP